ncbi:acyl-CoA Delta(11) desaturase-like, partial [Tropilaelaps mercedesae]
VAFRELSCTQAYSDDEVFTSRWQTVFTLTTDTESVACKPINAGPVKELKELKELKASGVTTDKDEDAQADGSIRAGEFKAQVVWQNVFVFVLLHSAMLYGIYISLFYAMWRTWLFAAVRLLPLGVEHSTLSIDDIFAPFFLRHTSYKCIASAQPSSPARKYSF